MIIVKIIYYLTLLIILTAISVYFTLVNISINQTYQKKENSPAGVKKIVAYSLLKQIEVESEEYPCEGRFSSSVINASEVHNEGRDFGWENDDIDWTNIPETDLYVSTVNLDKRLEPYHYVRIVGMVKGNWNRTLFCQIQTSPGSYHVTKAVVSPIWSKAWDINDTHTYFNPVLVSCRIPLGTTPKSVSLTTRACGQIRPVCNFKITSREIKNRTTFTICVKPLDFLEDVSKRLIQWIEISRILGAEKIEFYVKRASRNVRKVLQWYSSTYPEQIVIRKFNRIHSGMKSTNPINVSYDFAQSTWQRRRYEVIAYNNCFYRNIHTSHFVVPLDTDEIIVPREHFTWKDLLRNVFSSRQKLQRTFASFTVPNAYFFRESGGEGDDEIFFLRNVHRSQFSPAGESGKSFISTKNALSVFNHYALDALRPGISRAYFLPSSVVQLNHYKEKCNAVISPEYLRYFSSLRILDDVILKYRKLFIGEYNDRVVEMQKLGIL